MEVITGERKNMKLRILNITIWNLFVFLILNCSIGSAREACKNNLKKGDIFNASPDSCEFGLAALLFTQKDNKSISEFENRKNTFFNFNLINCYQYYEKLRKRNLIQSKFGTLEEAFEFFLFLRLRVGCFLNTKFASSLIVQFP